MDITVNGLKERNEPSKNTVNGHAITDLQYKHINDRLEQIKQFLEQEIDNKLQTIEEQRNEIEKLRNEIEQKSEALATLQQQLQQSVQHTEGHRQLINKLLNDIEHYQNDIDWYKRTYERRSIWGVIKEKLTRKS
jgi:DNA repair exonuclease SbcCD ATPase subunit